MSLREGWTVSEFWAAVEGLPELFREVRICCACPKCNGEACTMEADEEGTKLRCGGCEFRQAFPNVDPQGVEEAILRVAAGSDKLP
jgi:hypothetical protein